jgi:hypothetical protein
MDGADGRGGVGRWAQRIGRTTFVGTHLVGAAELLQMGTKGFNQGADRTRLCLGKILYVLGRTSHGGQRRRQRSSWRRLMQNNREKERERQDMVQTSSSQTSVGTEVVKCRFPALP